MEGTIYISRLKLENILGFSDSRIVDLEFKRPGGKYTGWTVVAGRNGAGKTSLLRCIALTLAAHPETARAMVPNYVMWRSYFDEKTTGKMSAEFFLDAGDLSDLKLAGRPEKPGTHAHVDITLSPSKEIARAGRHRGMHLGTKWTQQINCDDDDAEVDQVLLPTKNWFAAGYGPFRRLSSDISDPGSTPSGSIDPMDPSSVVDRFSTLFHEDASLGEGVSWLVGLHLRSLENEKGAARLLGTVLEVLSDGLLPDGYSAVRVSSSGLWVKRRTGKAFPLREMSDGFRTVTALVLDIIRQLHTFYGTLRTRRSKSGIAIYAPGVILIDEVDAHLHVEWQQRIGGWLKSHFPRIQFIVSTHSPYICQSADPGGLIRLPGLNEDAPPQVVGEQLYRRIVYGSGDDAALSDLFGLDTPYGSEAERLRSRLVELEERVLDGSASKAEVRQYREMSDTLTSSLNARVDEVSGRLGRKN
ncbi:AAA family ATPase [Streptomyces cavourensis]|uniref:AAA family ATPase n=1 Tax=Streptomyces cavourensis TaxID=67258 RepID=UPI0027E488B0|nr:AAA family ATPase [Streptomyces cavourensis]